MDKLRAMDTFVRIVDGGSLTAAAAALRSSLPAVVRQLATLEAALEVRLLNRTTRRIALTDEGREYYERCKRVLSDVEEAETALSARRATPRGRLVLTAPVMFGKLHVAPIVADFVVEHPEVHMELIVLDRVVDLIEEGMDAGVRIGHLPDSSLVAIQVGETRRVVCASPRYLKGVRPPKSPADVVRHRCVSFGSPSPRHEWGFNANGERVSIRPAFASNHIDPALDACLRGIGLGQFFSYQVQAWLDTGKLKRVLTEFEPDPVPIHVIYPHGRLLSANVRAFVDWTVPRLRERMRHADPERPKAAEPAKSTTRAQPQRAQTKRRGENTRRRG